MKSPSYFFLWIDCRRYSMGSAIAIAMSSVSPRISVIPGVVPVGQYDMCNHHMDFRVYHRGAQPICCVSRHQICKTCLGQSVCTALPTELGVDGEIGCPICNDVYRSTDPTAAAPLSIPEHRAISNLSMAAQHGDSRLSIV